MHAIFIFWGLCFGGSIVQLGGCSSWFCVDSNQGRVKTGEGMGISRFCVGGFLSFSLGTVYLLK